jgi:hypothetical protein
MTESSIQSTKLQWKWVGITFAMYILLYLLPMFIVSIFFRDTIAVKLLGGWMFGGIIVVAAVAGYLSKGVTIWEPAIAGAGLVLGIFVCLIVYSRVVYSMSFNMMREILGILIPTIIVFLLSLMGAWFGERAQKLWRTKSSEKN